MAIYQVVLKAILAGTDEQRNVHWYDSPGGVLSLAEEQDLVDALEDEYRDNLQTFLSSQLTVYGGDVRRVDVASLPVNSYTFTAGSFAGLDASNLLPSQVAAIVSFKANTAYPRRARTYMFAVGEDCNNSVGKTDGTFDGALSDWAGDILSLALPGGKTLNKVAARYEGSPPTVTASNILTSYATQRVWATQRGRRLGVGA